MKKYIIPLLVALPVVTFAQSAIDAQQVSQSDFKGTARFMAMGGAFTALGGDLTTLNQNPAGIGIYRSSEIGVSMDINFQNTKTEPFYRLAGNSNSQTKVYCPNFGYVGATVLNGALKTFNWGVSYNRAATFDRVYRGGMASTQTSLSNYIAAFTTQSGVPYSDMEFGTNYNPYLNSSIDWLSILGYNSYMINPVSASSYSGLYQNGTQGDAIFYVKETGYVDEYNMSFGGNVENVVYWGLTIGITDLHYTRSLYYSESMSDAAISNYGNGITTGSAGFEMNTRKYINGTGWNLKAGVILKPINELRIGLAVHTPTWYKFDQGYDATVDYAYTPNATASQTFSGNEYTDDAYFRWRFNSPWKIMAGIAGVIDGRAIVSLDYQYDGYSNMGIKTPSNYGYDEDYQTNDALNQDIKDYFKGSSTVRLGLEYRVTPQFSLRAGYNYQTTNVKDQAKNGNIEVLTSGTDASYTFNKDVQNICFGLGYRYQAWYIDAAYVYTNRQSTYHAYTNFDISSGGVAGSVAPVWSVKDNNSSIILSTGFKF